MNEKVSEIIFTSHKQEVYSYYENTKNYLFPYLKTYDMLISLLEVLIPLWQRSEN